MATHAIDRTAVIAAVGGVVALALLPLLFLGPGTDLDAGAVIRSGRGIVDRWRYTPSRAPGAPVHETAVGVLDRLGGTVGTNLGSLVAAAACVALLVALLRRCGVSRVGLAVAVVVANPWFLLSASSTVDFLWALALVLGAAVVLRGGGRAGAGRAVAAGLLAALAIGSRSSTIGLVIALVVAEALDARPGATDGVSSGSARAAVRRAAVVAVVAAAGGLLLFVPAFRAAGDSLAFAQNDVSSSSLPVQAGRFAAKDLYFFGPFAAVVLLLCLPGALRVLRTWRASWLVRFSSLGLVISQVLFLRYPWKMGHLLPSLVCLALLLAVALRDRQRLLLALVVAQLVYGVANVRLLEPDNPNAATGAKLVFQPAAGVLIVDTRCRDDDTSAWKHGQAAIDAVWNCAKPWAR